MYVHLVVPSQAMGKAVTYGIKDSRSIKDQRESLPIFRLKDQLVQAVNDNQVCVCVCVCVCVPACVTRRPCLCMHEPRNIALLPSVLL